MYYGDGITKDPATFEADKEASIIFKAGPSSALYNHTSDVYVHIGVVEGADWLYVPAAWDQNVAKCKMEKMQDNMWRLKFTSSIRSWFGAPSGTPISKIGIVFRNEDGTKKGLASDTFINVTDNSFTPGAVVNAPQPAGTKEGINIVDATTVTLVFYDKDKNGSRKDYAYLIGDFNNWRLDNTYQMKRDDATGCWWYTVTGLNAQTEYAFQYYAGSANDGAIRLADAYTEKILDPANDSYIAASTYPDQKQYPTGKTSGIVSTFCIQPKIYSWEVTDFKVKDNNQLVIYEMLLRDFTSTGDINGAMAKLDYLKMLGVNTIELMPVQEFDGNDSWGYNPCFFFAMDKAYGTKQMYKQFIDACHKKGFAVILDVVYNHATGNHPFAKLYWNASTSKTAANNPWFNVDAPHPYSVFHDFNHESDLVKTFVKRNLKFLLEEYKIDGFRFDLTKGFTQKSSTESTASTKDDSRIAILKGYNDAIKAVKSDAIVILEHFCDLAEETELSNAGMMMWRNLNNAYCQSAMGYSSDSGFGALTTKGTSMKADAWVGFMESHDEERMAYKQAAYSTGDLKSNLDVRMKQLATNAALCFTVSGPKMIWQFGEMGYDVSIDENGRTGKKPLHWEYLDNASRKGLYDVYAKLLNLRKANPVLFSQEAFKSWSVATSDWANGRDIVLETVDGKKLVVVGNFTNAEITRTVTFPATGTWTNYIDNTPVNVSAASYGVKVPAHEFRLYVQNVQ